VDPEAFTEYFFENFTVYTAKDYQKRITPTSKKETYPFKYPWEMIRLSALKIAPHISWVLMDGFLVGADGERRWVERLKVDTLNVEYAEDLFAEPKIWVQSMSNSEIRERLAKPNRGRAQAVQPPIPFEDKRADTWYRLGTPSKEYRRYFEPFMWLASFGVFFQAFVDHLLDEGRDVTLLDFRQDFHEWLQERFQKHEDKSSVEVRFHEWMEAIGNATDFRNFVTSYKDWLWNQCYTDKERAGIALWGEVHVFTAIKPPYSGPHEMKTVVTPYVHSVFGDMYGDHLKKVAPVHEAPRKLVGAVVCKHKKLTGYKPQVGDCVAFAADDGGKWWKPEPETKASSNGWSDDIWFGYVTRIVGERVYIVWLYRPSDTILRGGKYPWPNEVCCSFDLAKLHPLT
jgi:DNA (cytosine-5)-methyltransferase 1